MHCQTRIGTAVVAKRKSHSLLSSSKRFCKKGVERGQFHQKMEIAE